MRPGEMLFEVEDIPDRKARAARIFTLLEQEFPEAATELEFRNTFQLLVAIILSAQTTDVNVNKATPALFQRFPTAKALSTANIKELEKLVYSTGYYKNKARNIKAMATKLVEDFRGKVPSTMQELLTLPGVGRKTANVLLGVAFGIAVGFVVDTHVYRIARLLGLSYKKSAEQVEVDLMNTFAENQWVLASHLFILHGRKPCIARRPKCEICPIAALCPSAQAKLD